ncbi:MAG: GNAT family N-acetyltransferase [Pseudoalteromonas spongiae]
MKFETLNSSHSKQLLDFELENKAWFESFIAPRDADFYSNVGVSKHVAVLEATMRSKSGYSAVLIQNNAIVARANLKDITDDTAYIGYRVAKNMTSQGIASLCVAQLIKVAAQQFSLTTLRAQVLNNNPASERVLHKFAFQAASTHPDFLCLNGQSLACTEFSLRLSELNQQALQAKSSLVSSKVGC